MNRKTYTVLKTKAGVSLLFSEQPIDMSDNPDLQITLEGWFHSAEAVEGEDGRDNGNAKETA